MIQATVRKSRKWANELQENITGNGGDDNKVWIVPVPFCPMRYLIDANSLPGVTTLNTKRKHNTT